MSQKGKTIQINNIQVNISCLNSAMKHIQYPEYNNARISHILFPLWEKSKKSLDHIMPYITYEDGYVDNFKTIIQNDKFFDN